jgi:hypothetical protein
MSDSLDRDNIDTIAELRIELIAVKSERNKATRLIKQAISILENTEAWLAKDEWGKYSFMESVKIYEEKSEHINNIQDCLVALKCL